MVSFGNGKGVNANLSMGLAFEPAWTAFRIGLATRMLSLILFRSV
jgi:hypothetical protein